MSPTAAHPKLVASKKAVIKAEYALEMALSEVQALCPHPVVAHYAQTSQYYCSEPRRICYRCRLEEIGSHWSYTAQGSWRSREGEAQLGPHEDRVIVDLSSKRSDFFKLRLS